MDLKYPDFETCKRLSCFVVAVLNTDKTWYLIPWNEFHVHTSSKLKLRRKYVIIFGTKMSQMMADVLSVQFSYTIRMSPNVPLSFMLYFM